jgi:hypothetical protein
LEETSDKENADVRPEEFYTEGGDFIETLIFTVVMTGMHHGQALGL